MFKIAIYQQELDLKAVAGLCVCSKCTLHAHNSASLFGLLMLHGQVMTSGTASFGAYRLQESMMSCLVTGWLPETVLPQPE